MRALVKNRSTGSNHAKSEKKLQQALDGYALGYNEKLSLTNSVFPVQRIVINLQFAKKSASG
jgi:hypothetical protein